MERAAIRRHVDVVDVPTGTVLLYEGDGPRWFYAVVEGTAVVSVDGDVVNELGAGDLVNDIEILQNWPAPATVTAGDGLRVLTIGRREFLGMLDEVPGLARRLLVPHIPKIPAASRRRPALVPLPAA